jgi:hypothetical protein
MELIARSLPQLPEVASGLYKHKAKFLLAVPKSIDKIELKVRKFVLFHSLQMIIFCSDIGLQILSECNR